MRILSYNIHKCIGGKDRLYRFERIVDVIERENPDVICLQEVDRNVRRSRFHNQPRKLKSIFPSEGFLYQLNVQLKTGGYGNLIISRWPFISRHQVSLTYKQRKRRGGQIVVIDTYEGPLHLVNWHLGLSDTERKWQVAHLLEHRSFREHDDLPTILIGDTNDWRDSLEDAEFKRRGYHQVTSPMSRFRTFPAYLPVGALDKAFVNQRVNVKAARVVRTARSREASDHLPLVIDFHLPGRTN